MSSTDGLIGPLAGIIDAVLADPAARDQAKLKLLELRASPQLDGAKTRLSALLGESARADRWTSRARPSFLYVMYALLLWSIPMGLIAAVRPELAAAIARGMNAYLSGLPEPLYTLFGTGYLGYTVARQWGKAKGTDR